MPRELESFIASIDNFDGLPSPRQNEFLVYFRTEVQSAPFATASEIVAMRDQLNLHHFRTAQDLSERTRRNASGQAPFVKKDRGYALERSALQTIRGMVDSRPSRRALAKELAGILETVPAGSRREYLAEALGCFQSNYMRAAVVLTWCVSFDVVRDWLFAKHLVEINKRTQSWKKSLQISRVEDFAEITERTVIDLARDIRAFTKEEHKVISGLLDRRNSYAHPTGRTISRATVEAFIEENINEIVRKFF